jgi:hypothetical protein
MKTQRNSTLGWLGLVVLAVVCASTFAGIEGETYAQDKVLRSNETGKLARRRPAKEGAFTEFPTTTPNIAQPAAAPAAAPAAQTASATNATVLPAVAAPVMVTAPVAIAAPAPALISDSFSATGELPAMKWAWLTALGVLTFGAVVLGTHLVMRKEGGVTVA